MDSNLHLHQRIINQYKRVGEAMSVSALISSFLVAHKTLAKQLKIPYMIHQSGVPMILPSSGSIGNNGALTGLTALPATLTSAYMYFPANAISAGSAAGWYYVVMSSTTAGTIYNNTYTSGVPRIPSSPTAFATTGPGAYTQTTGADITALSISIPGGTLGINGSMINYPAIFTNSTAGNKIFRLKMGGSILNNLGFTTSLESFLVCVFKNAGAANVNISNNVAGFGTNTANSPTMSSIDTSSDQTLTVTMNLATATDYIGTFGLHTQINPSN
jgi:hypothetical protein